MNQCAYFLNDSTQETIQIAPDKTILDGLLENKLPIQKACINGSCGICLVRLIKGEIDYSGRVPRGLNSKELDTGYILPCIARCKSNVVIQATPLRTRK